MIARANPETLLGSPASSESPVSDTFAGIAPSSVPAFIAAQILGGILAIGVIKTLYPAITAAEAADIIVPHQDRAGPAAHDGPAPSPDRPPGPVWPS